MDYNLYFYSFSIYCSNHFFFFFFHIPQGSVREMMYRYEIIYVRSILIIIV